MTDQELLLKKIARRRLVGALTLVVVMAIVLPLVLRDRSVDNVQPDVRITVVRQAPESTPLLELPDEDTGGADQATSPPPAASAAVSPGDAASETEHARQPAHSDEAQTSASASSAADRVVIGSALPPTSANTKATRSPQVTSSAAAVVEPTPSPQSANTAQTQNKSAPQAAAVSRLPSKVDTEASNKTHAVSTDQPFYVQYGVFSDRANASQLAAKLAKAGLKTHTETANAAGHIWRLRSDMQATRAQAVHLLQQAQALGVNGMIVGKKSDD